MKKSLITLSVLAVLTLAVILFVFGPGDKSSLYTSSNFTEIPFEKDSIFTSHKVETENTLVEYEDTTSKSELVDEASFYIDENIDAQGVFDWKKDDVLLSFNDLLNRKTKIPVVSNTKAEAEVLKISDMLKEGFENAKEYQAPKVQMSVSVNSAYRYEPVRIFANVDSKSPVTNALMFAVYKGDNKVRKNGDDRYYINVFKNENNMYYATYLHAFGGPLGEYKGVIYLQTRDGSYAYAVDFTMRGRQSPPAGKTKKILTMEYNVDLSTKQIPGIDGKMTTYDGIYDWVRYMKCDMFWILAGQTTGWDNTVNKTNPWMSGPKKNLELMAKSKSKKDVKLGAYIMSYYTPGNGNIKADYEVAVGYNKETKTLGSSRHISLASEKRLNDIIGLLKTYDADENVSYLGLDFIRTGELDGYELVDDMVEMTGVYTPQGWSKMSKNDRMLWLARNRFTLREINMKWRWYRAQKVANIVKSIKESGIKKPLWVFTLGWDHGQEHGQDPYMFFDAGADFDAIMIYEANRPQHVSMLLQWPKYLAGDYNVLVGNMIDVRLQDGSVRPEIEYIRRIYESEARFNRTSRIRGVFFHDISRMFWSRNRGKGIHEWTQINASIVSRVEEKYGENPLNVSMELNEKNRTGVLTIKNVTSSDLNNISITAIAGSGLASLTVDEKTVSIPVKGKVSIPFKYSYPSSGASSSLITFRVKTSNGAENVVIAYTLLSNLAQAQAKQKAEAAAAAAATNLSELSQTNESNVNASDDDTYPKKKKKKEKMQ